MTAYTQEGSKGLEERRYPDRERKPLLYQLMKNNQNLSFVRFDKMVTIMMDYIGQKVGWPV